MNQTEQIKEILPNAVVRDNSLSIFAHTTTVNFEEMTKLLKLGFQDIKRSGGGLTLTFKIIN